MKKPVPSERSRSGDCLAADAAPIGAKRDRRARLSRDQLAPPTFRVRAGCSTNLSYRPMIRDKRSPEDLHLMRPGNRGTVRLAGDSGTLVRLRLPNWDQKKCPQQTAWPRERLPAGEAILQRPRGGIICTCTEPCLRRLKSTLRADTSLRDLLLGYAGFHDAHGRTCTSNSPGLSRVESTLRADTWLRDLLHWAT